MTTWKIDPSHSAINFAVRHLMISKVRGRFTSFSGDAVYDDAAKTWTSAEGSIDIASVDTHEEKRDAHLKSVDFFDAEKFPKMTFKSKRIEPSGKGHYKVTGDLTIKGITKPVTLNVVKYGEFNDPNMGHRIGYAAETEINRKDFGMKFDMMLDGKFIVSNDIQIHIEGEIVEAKEAETAGSASS